jgi:hypothetical protein
MEDELQTLVALVALSKLVEVGGWRGLIFVAADCVPLQVLLSNALLLKPLSDSRNVVKGASVLLGTSILSKCSCNRA